MLNPECVRIADQLRRAFAGKAWHGDSLRELLSSVNAGQAQKYLVPGAHSIWEIVLHIGVWEHAAMDAVAGTPLPPDLPPERDWPRVTHGSQDQWQKAWTSSLP